MEYREVNTSDIPDLAKLRSMDWGTREYWTNRISGYIGGERNPQYALPPRVLYVASDNEKIIGFIAGHLSSRFNCDGELQWINVHPTYQRKGIASELLKVLTKWFVGQQARKICVDADPDDEKAQNFYKQNRARKLSEHWLVWDDIGVLIE
ncbi:GNAT family N-acetyltransferase [Leptobacterium flavescens]|uniref:GNAT family N-acetyltransferase n=1 Tax=Leptobacterium flavescens TaxID=472055 RepID=A0A6P0UHZ2_9FLAO|nr:GNAT family N-acetyltransferase [Leptobacterium flavescens]NER12864.1 GNAT family N-acetyltransferase [Leptobacterium flavescens]